MPASDFSSILDPSTALGAVLGWLVEMFPATGEVDILKVFQAIAPVGASLWIVGFCLLSGLSGRLVVTMASLLKASAVLSGLWVAFILIADGFLLIIAATVRLSHGALVVVPAFLSGAVIADLIMSMLVVSATAAAEYIVPKVRRRFAKWLAEHRTEADPC